MAGIDAVDVARQDLTAIPGGVGAGVKYFITFTGDNVRGNVPPLQIVDVGINGCLDATDLGGTFKDSLAPIVVEQVEIPYIPFYEVQTTVDIPCDASSDDMKAAMLIIIPSKSAWHQNINLALTILHQQPPKLT